MMIVSGRKKTDKAVKILHDRYIGDDTGRLASLEKERISAQMARMIYRMKAEAGLTQQQLARLVKTTQSVISRLEDADYEGHSMSMVTRIATALDRRFTVQLVERGEKKKIITGEK